MTYAKIFKLNLVSAADFNISRVLKPLKIVPMKTKNIAIENINNLSTVSKDLELWSVRLCQLPTMANVGKKNAAE
jgi:hypothetical protein